MTTLWETNPARQAMTERFRAIAIAFNRMASEVEIAALSLDDSAVNCSSCGSTHYNNWAQRQLRSRVTGAAERLREIAAEFQRRSTDDEFLGKTSPEVARRALQASLKVEKSGDGMIVSMPTGVWDLIQQALGRESKASS